MNETAEPLPVIVGAQAGAVRPSQRSLEARPVCVAAHIDAERVVARHWQP